MIRGAAAATPEALMRARYSAYVKTEVDFLLSSLHPDSAGGSDAASTRAWSESADWHGLEVLSTSAGATDDELGEVEFVAKYSLKGEPQRHHEKATFKRHQGRWLYLEGEQLHPDPVVGPKIRLGRNDPCLCGSGRKYKKCCYVVFGAGTGDAEALVRARFTAALVGEGRFIERSVHPEATQQDSAASGEPPLKQEILEVQQSGDTAQVRVGESPSESEPSVRRVHHLKRLGDRFLWLRSEAAA